MEVLVEMEREENAQHSSHRKKRQPTREMMLILETCMFV
jgi:hypothetical protein